jgi:hypothetical protein
LFVASCARAGEAVKAETASASALPEDKAVPFREIILFIASLSPAVAGAKNPPSRSPANDPDISEIRLRRNSGSFAAATFVKGV